MGFPYGKEDRRGGIRNYNIGAIYKQGKIDVCSEIIPQNSAFKSYAGEKYFFEDREGNVFFYQVTDAIASGMLTDLDKTLIGIIATFGSACVTSRVLKEMLTMMNIQYSDNIFESSLKRLHRFHLINFSRFVVEGKEPTKMRIVTLANYGSKLAKRLGVVHRFNPMAITSAEAYAVKSRAQTAQLISNYLKQQFVDFFAVRPVIVVDVERGAIIRPAASITIQGSEIFFEVPRRRDGWIEDLSEKLMRYELVFEGKDTPTVVINGEDEEMNKEVAKMVEKHGYNIEILYTDDLAMFGEKFRYSLYDLSPDGTKHCFEFVALDMAA